MAGHFVAITQQSGPINFIASGTYTQPADDNVDAHIDCGFRPRLVIVSGDMLGTVQAALMTQEMTAGTSLNLINAEDIATAITIRDNWTVTNAEYYIRDGVSRLSTADAEVDKIHGFSMGTAVNGTDNDVNYWVAIG